MTPKIKIVVQQIDDYRHSFELHVNNQFVGSGNFGGEPEDNSYYRDYDWVVPAFKRLAEKLNVPFQLEEYPL